MAERYELCTVYKVLYKYDEKPDLYVAVWDTERKSLKKAIRDYKIAKLLEGKMLAGYCKKNVRRKLDHCLRMARVASSDYRESGDKRYLELKQECLEDAAYWREILKKLEGND